MPVGMPFAFDSDQSSWTRPIKKRKITDLVAMARYRRDSGSSPEPEPEPPTGSKAYRGPSSRKGSFEEKEDKEIRTSDREELIQCIKRGQRPTWVPKPNLEALCAEADAQAEARLIKERQPPPVERNPVLPDNQAQNQHNILQEIPSKHAQPPHSTPEDSGGPSNSHGNARGIPQPSKRFIGSQVPFPDSPPSWLTQSTFSLFQRTVSDPAGLARVQTDSHPRSRAPSIGSSLSSSYVMRVPTSPLVHATTNLSIESPSDQTPGLSSLSRSKRTSLEFSAAFTPPGLRKEATVPMSGHQNRRSLSSFTYQPSLSASTVYPSRQRRLSYASETSSRQRNSMLGSFEESILKGRMSTAPSNPLQFVAKIGVSGKGPSCPPKLQCPAHVTVPFPAVFYNYPSSAGSRTISDDSPSPYGGTIDLRQHLEAPDQRRTRNRRATVNDVDLSMTEVMPSLDVSGGPKSKIGGSYRVPQQGQLQIILKNPENTAVKLFLVPYDLEGMLPDTKTFVRQRSFSSGPMIENVLTDKPIQDPLSSKQFLRYAIHLKFCCIGKGRFYLYDNIRVVFANRVPDGKEQLRNEIQLPEPRYSSMGLSNSQPASRRQSGIDDFLPSPRIEPQSPQLDLLDDLAASSPSPFSENPVPFQLAYIGAQASQKENLELLKQTAGVPSSNLSRPTSPEVYGFDRSSVSQRGSPVPWGSTIDLQPRSPSPALNGDGQGLLSKKLRELERQSAKTQS